MTALEYLLDGLEAELELERELGVRVVELDRTLLASPPHSSTPPLADLVLLANRVRAAAERLGEAIGATYLRHKAAFDALARQTRTLHADCLPLTAGACTLCKKCTCPDRPCRFPGKRLSSMEAYGLLVSDVCLKSGLEYNYGPKTITYTSCILFN